MVALSLNSMVKAKERLLLILLFVFTILVNQPADGSNSFHSYKLIPDTINGYFVVDGVDGLVNHSIVVGANGTLVIQNSELKFYSDGKGHIEIYVSGGGRLIIRSSVLEAINKTRLSIYVDSGGYIELKRSTFINLGWKLPTTKNYLFPGVGFTNDTSHRGHGLEIAGHVGSFIGNTFINVTSIRFYSGNVEVVDNLIISPLHEGLAFFGSNNMIVNNRIINASTEYREIHGIRFYPGSHGNIVKDNYISRIPVGITISLIDPWIKNEDYLIVNNTIQKAFIGMAVEGKNITIEKNRIYNTFVHAIFLNDCEKVVVRNNKISNFTYLIPYMYTEDYWNEIKRLFNNRDWYDFLIMQRGGILIGWRARDITITGNTISYAPVFGYGVGFDVRYSATNISIVGNYFSHIADGYYLEEEGYIHPPNLYSVPLSTLQRATGAAIELESTSNVYISENTFDRCLNGIVTAFPDAIGNFGNLVIRDNQFRGIDPNEWPEYYRKGYGPIVAIGIGTSAFNPKENDERGRIFDLNSNTTILRNGISNYVYGLVVDNTDPAKRSFTISSNTISGYFDNILNNAEMSESNRLINRIVPNGVAADLSISPSVSMANEKTKVVATVRIVNFTPISMLFKMPFNAVLYIDDSQVKRVKLDSDGTYHLVYNWTVSGEGKHRISLIVDPLDAIRESNETDNSIEIMLDVSPSSEKIGSGEVVVKRSYYESTPNSDKIYIQEKKTTTIPGFETHLATLILLIALILQRKAKR